MKPPRNTPGNLIKRCSTATVEGLVAKISVSSGLTKLNYKACRLGEGEPVTIKFSNAVGEIFISNPTVTGHRPNFKFYI
jgi:hypothetical protein